MQLPVYLDYAASTPVDPAVVELMTHCLRRPELAANPAALGHAAGRAAQALVETARAQVAALINAQPAEIIFTSGATEADNLAVIGAAQFRQSRGRHLVTSLTEHKAVIESCRHLATLGWRITWLKPDADGLIAPAAVEAALEPDTVLVSLMHVNNETGVIQDIAAIGAICRRHDVLLHVDAAQSAGREVIDVRAQQIDLLSLSAHKLYGPKGVGALFIDQERVRRVSPLLFGGGQELSLRPGTVATHQVAGMGEAFRLAAQRLPDEAQHVRALRDRLWAGLQALPGVLLNGHVRAAERTHTQCEHRGCGRREPLLQPRRSVRGQRFGLYQPEQRGLLCAACARSPGSARAELDPLFFRPADDCGRSRFRPRLRAAGRAASAQFQPRQRGGCLRHGLFERGCPAFRRAPACRDARARSGYAGVRRRGLCGAGCLGGVSGCGSMPAGCVALAWQAWGCPHVIAACSLAAERSPAAHPRNCGTFEPLSLRAPLDVPALKTGRLLFIQDALRKCLAAWDNGGQRIPFIRGIDGGGRTD